MQFVLWTHTRVEKHQQLLGKNQRASEFAIFFNLSEDGEYRERG